VRYSIAAPAANRTLWVLSRDDVQLAIFESLKLAIEQALALLHADKAQGRDARLFINGIEVVVKGVTDTSEAR
jgi:hypothetical protein